MLERELQDYLFENPDVLFPGQEITSKQREVSIEGRRIDLLFDVDSVHYIVELKRDTIKREHIGQIFEYYGLMRQSKPTATYKMILVAPSIPAYRRLILEEFGIRCVELSNPFERAQEQALAVKDAVNKQQREPLDPSAPVELKHVSFKDFSPPVTPNSVQISHQVLRDALPAIQEAFSEYEVVPVRMANSKTSDVLCFAALDEDAKSRWNSGGVWWAYSFGHSDQMPKNDMPNISVMKFPWGLDFTVNAELQTSQKVMLSRIARSTTKFDRLVGEHGNLQLQTWFKIEYQPRMYHWVLLTRRPQGDWRGQSILDLYRDSERNFDGLRQYWVESIIRNRPELTESQTKHMKATNRKLNLALRLVHSFAEDDEIWDVPYGEQKALFAASYCKLKPLIDFFQ